MGDVEMSRCREGRCRPPRWELTHRGKLLERGELFRPQTMKACSHMMSRLKEEHRAAPRRP